VSETKVLERTIRLREGLTIYTRAGNAPALVLSVLLLLWGALWSRRLRRAR
jgi:apolipoprotein N-acyltransferase